MVLTAKQEQGLKIAVQRHKDGEKYTVISGYAGTGKSTLVRFIISAFANGNQIAERNHPAEEAAGMESTLTDDQIHPSLQKNLFPAAEFY